MVHTRVRTEQNSINLVMRPGCLYLANMYCTLSLFYVSKNKLSTPKGSLPDPSGCLSSTNYVCAEACETYSEEWQ